MFCGLRVIVAVLPALEARATASREGAGHPVEEAAQPQVRADDGGEDARA
jgi:hypothetical protein